MSPHHSDRIQIIAFLLLGIINIIVYILIFAASITKTIDGKLGEIIQAIYCCLFSIFLVFNELRTLSLIDDYFGFLKVYNGKGLMMLFLGCLVMCENAFNIIVSIFGFTLGLGYVILSFIPCVPLPKDLCYYFHTVRDPGMFGKFHSGAYTDPIPVVFAPEYNYHHHQPYALPLPLVPKQAVHPSSRNMASLNY